MLGAVKSSGGGIGAGRGNGFPSSDRSQPLALLFRLGNGGNKSSMMRLIPNFSKG